MLGIFAPFRACPPRTHSTSGAKSGLDHRLAPFVRQVDALDAFVVGRHVRAVADTLGACNVHRLTHVTAEGLRRHSVRSAADDCL